LLSLFTIEREESLTLVKVKEWMSQESIGFEDEELQAGLDKMMEHGNIMVAENFVFLI